MESSVPDMFFLHSFACFMEPFTRKIEELLAYLLDGLHEDLNLVKVERKDLLDSKLCVDIS